MNPHNNKTMQIRSNYFPMQSQMYAQIPEDIPCTPFAADVGSLTHKGAKKYFYVPNHKLVDFWRSAGNLNAYEIIRENAPARVALDIDGTAAAFGEINVQNELSTGRLCKAIVEFLENKFAMFGQACKNIVVETSHSSSKFSYHIRMMDVTVANFASLKNIAKVWNEELRSVCTFLCNDEFDGERLDSATIIDTSVYTKNRCWRHAGQSKMGTDRLIKSPVDVPDWFVTFGLPVDAHCFDPGVLEDCPPSPRRQPVIGAPRTITIRPVSQKSQMKAEQML